MIRGGLDDTESSTPGLACITEQNRYHKVLKNNSSYGVHILVWSPVGWQQCLSFILFWSFGLLWCFTNLLKLDVQELFCLIAERNVLASVSNLRF